MISFQTSGEPGRVQITRNLHSGSVHIWNRKAGSANFGVGTESTPTDMATPQPRYDADIRDFLCWKDATASAVYGDPWRLTELAD